MNGNKSLELNYEFDRTFLRYSVRTTGYAGSWSDGVGFGECVGEVRLIPTIVFKSKLVNGRQ